LYFRHLDRGVEWKVEVVEGEISIGCSETATVPVPDSSLAAREIAITRKDDGYYVSDVSRKGRLVIQGAVAAEGRLKDGDRFRVGRLAALFLEVAPAENGQVEITRERTAAPPAVVLENAEKRRPGEKQEPRQRPPAAVPRSTWLGVLVAAFLAGLCIGILAWTRSNPTARAPEDGSHAAPTAKQTVKAPEAGAPKAPAVRPDTLETAIHDLQASLQKNGTPRAATPNALPAKYELGPISDPTASRIALVRLCLDLTGRPPTREEERQLLPLDFEKRWRAIWDRAVQEGGPNPALTGSVEAQFQELLGRAATSSEANEVASLASPERPFAFWISSLDEYRRPDRRRPRAPHVSAKSFIVDLVDRPPRSPEEVEAVAAAIAEPGSLVEAARTLAHSVPPPGHDAKPGVAWEDELVRFLLRAPTDAERKQLPALLDGLPEGSRRTWLRIALATLDEYGTY